MTLGRPSVVIDVHLSFQVGPRRMNIPGITELALRCASEAEYFFSLYTTLSVCDEPRKRGNEAEAIRRLTSTFPNYRSTADTYKAIFEVQERGRQIVNFAADQFDNFEIEYALRRARFEARLEKPVSFSGVPLPSYHHLALQALSQILLYGPIFMTPTEYAPGPFTELSIEELLEIVPSLYFAEEIRDGIIAESTQFTLSELVGPIRFPESISPPKAESIAICSLRNITEAFISLVDPEYDDSIYKAQNSQFVKMFTSEKEISKGGRGNRERFFEISHAVSVLQTHQQFESESDRQDFENKLREKASRNKFDKLLTKK